MALDEVTVFLLVESIWRDMLNLEVRRGSRAPSGANGFLTGRVPIRGTWEGQVVLACDRDLARESAGRMFGVPAREVTSEQVHDALGELTNMIGGNLHTLLEVDSQLGLPRTTETNEGIPSWCACVFHAAFWCHDWPFEVAVLPGEPSPGRRSERVHPGRRR